MKEDSKNYLLITIVGVALVGFGAYLYHLGGKTNEIFGGICFAIGFIIMLAIYGYKWFQWW